MTTIRSKGKQAIRRLALAIAVAAGLAVGMPGQSLDAHPADGQEVSPDVAAQMHLVGVRNMNDLFPPRW